VGTVYSSKRLICTTFPVAWCICVIMWCCFLLYMPLWLQIHHPACVVALLLTSVFMLITRENNTTPDDGRVRPKHVANGEVKWPERVALVTDIYICMIWNKWYTHIDATECWNKILWLMVFRVVLQGQGLEGQKSQVSSSYTVQP
jgi:hypothetical protein